MASGGRPPHSTPSLSLRSPSSTPSLSLRSPFTVPSDSLQTPDTSSLFISSLAADRASQGSGFTSLEDLLNFTGISHQMPSPTLSLESLARDMEQSQGPVLSAGPPEAKRLRLNVNPVTTSTAHSSLLSTHSSPLPPNIRVSTLPSSMAPVPQATDVPNLPSSWSLKTSSAPIPSLFPSSSSSSSSSVLLSSTSQPSATTTTGIPLYYNSALAASAPSRAQTLSQFTVSPPFPGNNLASLTAGAPLGSSGGLLSTAATPLAASAKTSSSLRSHSPGPSSSVSSRALAQGPSLPQYPFPTSLASSSFPIPSPTAISSVTTSPPNPLPTSSISQYPSVSGSAAGSSVGTASSAAQPARTTAPSGPLAPTALSVPSHPAQRALLVQLIQAYRQCTALGDVQGQVRVRAQLNLLLQAQQKVGGANSTHLVAPNAAQRPPLSTPSPVSQGPPAPFTHTLVNHTPQVKQFGQPKAPLTSTPSLTPPLTPSLTPIRSLPQAPPIAASLLANQGKSLDSAANRGVAMATNSLPSQIVAMGTAPHSVAMATTAGAAPVLSSSSADHTVAPITPSHGRALPSSGPASALKAAATSLYNLRLKQLQLFLQSLPEEERPRSIPELKALLQSSGGQLSALAQPAGSVGPSLPTPSITPQPTQRAPATQPMAVSMPAVVPTLLSTTAMQQPATGLPLSTTELASTDQSSSSLVSTVPSSGSALPTGGLPSLAVLTGLPQLANSFSLSGSAQHLPTNSRQQPLCTGLASASPTSSQQPPASSNTAPATTSIPVTTDKASPPLPSSASLAPPTTAGHNEPIKPGVPTPLPPGLNPETLAVLCRMPDAELQKLNLPVALTTAIRMWRGQHSTAAQRGRKSASHQNAGLPVIIPPSQLSQPHSSPSTPISTSQSSQALTAFNPQTSQPVMIPLSEGFPPRSLHAYVPGVTVGNYQSNMRNAMPPPTYSTTSLPPPRGHTPSRPLTRHQLRAEQTKVEKERAAVLNKVLQTSEEARIAYRFNMLTDKMTNQLMTPDSHTPFKSLHDVIARLLPYHMWSEAEPPPGAIEKADAVYESVAQVLMSRCHGLLSHYQHLIYHDAQRDSEAVMGVYLERLFLESEKERKEKENEERQQAAQIAADLSLIAGDSSLNFDPDFSLGDVMNSDPMLTFDPGIT